jgi:hypothetical protein
MVTNAPPLSLHHWLCVPVTGPMNILKYNVITHSHYLGVHQLMLFIPLITLTSMQIYSKRFPFRPPKKYEKPINFAPANCLGEEKKPYCKK